MFIYCTIAYIVGIALAIFYNIMPWYVWLIINVTAVALAIKYKNYRFFYFLLLICFFVFGLFITSTKIYFNTPTFLNAPTTNYLYAKIYKVEKSYFNGKTYLYLKDIIINNDSKNITTPSSAKIVYFRPNNFKTNDIIKAKVTLIPPSSALIPNGFSFKLNAKLNNIGANGYILGYATLIDNFNTNNIFYNSVNFIKQIQLSIKQYIIKQIDSVSSKQVAPFVASIAVGEYDFLPQEDLQNLRDSGLAHLISISGYHISILSGFVFLLTRLFLSFFTKLTLSYNTKKIAAIVTILFLLLYLFIVGNHPPAIRAGIMAIAVFLAVLLNFYTYAINSLFLAIFIILVFNPFAVYSVGFILSAFATLVIIAIVSSKWFLKIYNFKVNGYWQYLYNFLLYVLFLFVITLAIEIAISPILGFYFGSIPLLSVFANALSAPLFTFVLMPSVLIYLITPFVIGKYALIITHHSTNYMLQIADFFANYTFNYKNLSTFYINNVYAIWLILYLLGTITIIAIKFNTVKNIYTSIVKIFAYVTLALAIIGYFVTAKSPDILIDYNAEVVAIKYGNQSYEYAFNTAKQSFIKKVWFKNNNVDYKHTFADSIYITCTTNYCHSLINNYNVYITANSIVPTEWCLPNSIIIVTNYLNKNGVCVATHSKNLPTIIDKNYLQQSGSSFIYLNNSNKPKIISHK